MSLIIKKNRYSKSVGIDISKRGIVVKLYFFDIEILFESWKNYYVRGLFYEPKIDVEKDKKISDIIINHFFESIIKDNLKTKIKIIKSGVKNGLLKKEVLKEIKNLNEIDPDLTMFYNTDPENSNSVFFETTYFFEKDWFVLEKWQDIFKKDQEIYLQRKKEREENYKKYSFFDKLFNRVNNL